MTDAKQKFVDYREGSFIDFEGKDHYFVVCAVLKERVQVTKKIGYRIIRSIDLVSAPLDYIINNSKFKKL